MMKTFIKPALVSLVCCLFIDSFGQTRGDIAVPKVWLRADIDTTESVWKDVSGHENHAQLATSHSSDQLLFNFNPTRTFMENSNFSSIPFSLEGLSETTFMIVYQPGDTTERGIIGTKDGLERNVMVTTSRVLGPDSVIDVFEQGNRFVTMNTITQSWEEAKLPGEGASLTLGGITGTEEVNNFEGEIAEVLVFDQVIPFLNKVQYETYLGIKYGISLRERNYVSSAESVLWKAEENAEFSHRITGIGRDDYFKLYQKQSKNSLDTANFLLISAGTTQKDNRSNSAIFSDQDFILWGDNDQSLVDRKGEGEDSILSVLDRKWLVTVNGPTANTISNNIQIDLSQMPVDSLGFWLVIDRSGSNNFSIDNIEYIQADSISEDSIAFYNNIKWDPDRSGRDNFSFARMQDLFAVVRTVNRPVCKDPESGVVMIDVIKGEGPYEFFWQLEESEEGQKFNSEDSLTIDGLVAGSYNLKVKDSRGVTFERVKLMDMVDGLPVDLGPDQKLQEGNEIVLDATAGIPDSVEVTYDWESSYGFSSTKGKVTIAETGIYRVFVTNKANGCVFSDEIVISGSPIQRLEVFPNPINRNEIFNVSISLKEEQNIQLSFFDAKGNLHAEYESKGRSEYQFQVSLNKSGHFTMVVETPEGSNTKRIIIY